MRTRAADEETPVIKLRTCASPQKSKEHLLLPKTPVTFVDLVFKWHFRRTEAISGSYVSGIWYSYEKKFQNL